MEYIVSSIMQYFLMIQYCSIDIEQISIIRYIAYTWRVYRNFIVRYIVDHLKRIV